MGHESWQLLLLCNFGMRKEACLQYFINYCIRGNGIPCSSFSVLFYHLLYFSLVFRCPPWNGSLWNDGNISGVLRRKERIRSNQFFQTKNILSKNYGAKIILWQSSHLRLHCLTKRPVEEYSSIRELWAIIQDSTS